MRQKKKIAVIRALDLRLVQAEHAAHFKKLKPFFISNYNKEISDFLEKENATYIKLNLTPPYLFDPVWLLFKGSSHQSWLTFDRKSLKSALKPIDIYQIQEPFFLYSGQVAEVADKFNKPLISAPWMCFNHPSTYIPPYSFSVRKVIDKTSLFIMRSKRVNNYLARFNIPNSKKVLIYHGINTKRFFPLKKKTNNKVRILFVGILHSSKGVDDILDIFPQLIRKSKKKIELVICGRGGLEGRVLAMAKSLPIRYMGYVSNMNLPDIYRNADIFCGPSKDWYSFGVKRWEEGFGFVFAEAMASGLPIVTYKCGGVPELVGDSNMVNEQGDKKGLLRALYTLINDKKMRREIGLKSRERTKELFDLEKQVKEEEKIILNRFF